MKKKTSMTVLDSRQLAEGIYSLILAYPAGEAPRQVLPGQFAGIFPCDSSALLMRPISVCRWDPAEGSIRFVYRAAGRGTKNFTGLKTGDRVDMLGILGNGYEISRMRGKRVLLLGGGIGIPPMLELAAALKEEARSVTAVLGYRNRELFLADEFRREADNVLDAVRAAGIQADVICACGPMPMLRAVRDFARETGAACYISLEERMACGIGACLGCITKTRQTDAHSHVRNARICTEGPVFAAEEIDF